jgi:hypothetical protein
MMNVTCPTEALTSSHIVMILGDGRTSPMDYANFKKFGAEPDIACIGRSINFVPESIDHWMNVDGSEAIWWATNLVNKWRVKPQTHTLGEMRGFTHCWNIPQSDYGMEDVMWHGSTALFAVLTCLAMGYKRVVLCGCPMDANGHWYEPANKLGPRWTGECYQAWLDFKTEPESEKVKSLSGYTRIILGEPTQEWLSYQPG